MPNEIGPRTLSLENPVMFLAQNQLQKDAIPGSGCPDGIRPYEGFLVPHSEFGKTIPEKTRAVHVIDVGMSQNEVGERRQRASGPFDKIQNTCRGSSRTCVR